MKKTIIIVLCTVFLAACAFTNGEYKRISLVREMLGENKDTYNNAVNSKTKVEKRYDDEFPASIPIYSIKNVEVTEAVYEEFFKHFGFFGEYSYNGKYYDSDINGERNGNRRLKTSGLDQRNSISFEIQFDSKPITYSDEELKEMAQKIFDSLPCIEGEYEYVGISSTLTVSSEEGDYAERKRVSFRKVIDGMRVIGSDQCDIYFNHRGFCGLELDFVEYEKIGELDLIPLKSAHSLIKTPDAFVLYNSEETLEGAATSLKVERVKILLVNQSSMGCTILQPVYNFIGTAENESGSAEFHSRVIAIPKKYTYD